MTIPVSPIIILVHPGSLCGSADFNSGAHTAQVLRDGVATELEQWAGGILVLHGELSDELINHPRLDHAITSCLDNALTQGLFAVQCAAQDPEHAAIAVKQLRQHPLGPVSTKTQLLLTGAWYDPTGIYGCINSTQEALLRAGYKHTQISPSAAPVDQDNDAALDAVAPVRHKQAKG